MAYLASNLGYNTATVDAMTQGERPTASVINATLAKLNSSIEAMNKQGMTLFIPAGLTYSPAVVVPRNIKIDYAYVRCQDNTGTAQNPTSLTFSIIRDTTSVHTSSAITTSSTNGSLDINVDAGQLIRCTVSNTTGLTGGVSITLRSVNR